jgi:hypothetical protein
MNTMFHRHLVAAYTVTWIVQLSYLAYTCWKWAQARKAERENAKQGS